MRQAVIRPLVHSIQLQELTWLGLRGAVHAPWQVSVALLARAVRTRANIRAMPDLIPPAPPLATRARAELARTRERTRLRRRTGQPPSAIGSRRAQSRCRIAGRRGCRLPPLASRPLSGFRN